MRTLSPPVHGAVLTVHIILAGLQAMCKEPLQLAVVGFSAGVLHAAADVRAVKRWHPILGTKPRLRVVVWGAPALAPSLLQDIAEECRLVNARLTCLCHPLDTQCPIHPAQAGPALEAGYLTLVHAHGSMDKYLFGHAKHSLDLLTGDVLAADPPARWIIGEHSFHTNMALLQSAALLAAMSFPLHLLRPILLQLKKDRGIQLARLNELPECKAQPQQAVSLLKAVFEGTRLQGVGTFADACRFQPA